MTCATPNWFPTIYRWEMTQPYFREFERERERELKIRHLSTLPTVIVLWSAISSIKYHVTIA